MARMYELWDADTRNLIACSADRADMLAYVREIVGESGPGATNGLCLMWSDADDPEAGEAIATEAELRTLALNQP